MGAPWFVANSDDKKRGRLNIISHLLSQIPYVLLEPRDVKLPNRKAKGDHVRPNLPLRSVPDKVLRSFEFEQIQPRTQLRSPSVRNSRRPP